MPREIEFVPATFNKVDPARVSEKFRKIDQTVARMLYLDDIDSDQELLEWLENPERTTQWIGKSVLNHFRFNLHWILSKVKSDNADKLHFQMHYFEILDKETA